MGMNFKKFGKKLIALGVTTTVFMSTILTGYAAGSYDNNAEVRDASVEIAKQIQAEGIILLENEGTENGGLPFNGSEGIVSVFGTGSMDSFLGGGGSGKITADNPITFYEGLESAGIQYNERLYAFYEAWYEENADDSSYIGTGGATGQLVIPQLLAETPLSHLKNPSLGWQDENGNDKTSMPKDTDLLVNQWELAAELSDTAIVMISRSGSESADLAVDTLRLRETETELLDAVCDTYDNVIVLFNICNVMEMGFLEDYDNIKAAAIIWAPGEVGMESVGEMLAGIVTPSGKLVDTITYNIEDHPAVQNFGNYHYTTTGQEPVLVEEYVEWFPGFGWTNTYVTDGTGKNESGNYTEIGTGNTFLKYEEGIYVGYRYFETFGKTDLVQYPFGYGLSYSNFSWNADTVKYENGTVSVDVTVKNEGNASGKDVVEVYYSAPYNSGTGIEKTSIALAGYAKTGILAPGETETVTVSFDQYYMASYDMDNEYYYLEGGSYDIHIMTSLNGKNISNNTISKQSISVSETTYDEDPETNTPIENLFEDAVLGGTNGSSITVLSRENEFGTYPSSPSAEGISDYLQPFEQSEKDVFPTPETNGAAFEFDQTLDNAISLQDVYNAALKEAGIGSYEKASQEVKEKFEDIYFNSSIWDEFLSQLTIDEVISLIGEGGYQTAEVARLGIPGTQDNDGPAQIKGANGYSAVNAGVAYPVGTVVACTWNDDLAEEWGIRIGVDGTEVGTNVWYAPATNMHRTPLGGRNFEYFSEDPILAGKISAAVTRGVQSQDVIVTVKHFALNDCEQNREGLITWADEQTIREIYLKPFELSVKEGKAKGIMSSFNYIGLTWAGASKALLVDVLREEWGFKGFIVTDYYQWYGSGNYMHPALAVYAQNDVMLAPTWMGANTLKQYYNSIDPIGMSNAMYLCVKNICYMKSFTKAFDPGDSGNPDPQPGNLTGSYHWVVQGYDWGPGVNQLIIEFDESVNAADISLNTFNVTVNTEEREITDAYLSDSNGNKITGSTSKYVSVDMDVSTEYIEMQWGDFKFAFNNSTGSPFTYSNFNDWTDPYTHIITLNNTINGYSSLDLTDNGRITPESDKFDLTGTYTQDGVTLSYASYTPAEDSKQNPLVIWLHGGGEGGIDPNIALYGNKVVNLASDEIQDIFEGAYILTPQVDGAWMDGYNYYNTEATSPAEAGQSNYTETLFGLITNYVENNPDIDTDRIYIGGCSNGGYMTLNMIAEYGDYFAAAYPICAMYRDSHITDEMIARMAQTPMWFTHSLDDTTVDPKLTVLPTYERLVAAGADVHLTTTDNVIYDGNQFQGHWSWIYTLNNACYCDDASCEYSNITIFEWLQQYGKDNTIEPEKPYKGVLLDVIKWAEEMVDDGNLNNVLPAVKEAFQTAYNNAVNVYHNDEATKEDVINATAALARAIQSLFEEPDKEALRYLVILADYMMDNLDDYYDSLPDNPNVKNDFTAAYNAAIEILEDENFMDIAAIENAYDTLWAAIKNMRVIPNKDNLAKLIQVTEDLLASEANLYTEDSILALQAAYAAAIEEFNTYYTTQDAVDGATGVLQTALNNLKLKDTEQTDDTDDPKDTDQTDDTTDPKDTDQTDDTKDPKDTDQTDDTDDTKDTSDPKDTTDPKDTNDIKDTSTGKGTDSSSDGKTSGKTSVKTGDTTHISIYLLMLFSVVSLTAIVIKKKK